MEDKQELNFELVESEKVVPSYVNDSIISAPYQLYCINVSGQRVYFTFEDEVNFRNPTMYMGTGMITSVMPTPKELKKYIADKGWIPSQREMAMWSFYGSFSDGIIGYFIKNGKFENGLGGLPQQLRDYFYWQRFFTDDNEMNLMAKWIQRDMVGFEKFIADRKVDFFFTEFPVKSELDKTATRLDFGCFFDREIDVEGVKKDGTPKKNKEKAVERCCGLFNYKSGRIYPNYAIQCRAERTMFMESYPDFTNLPIRTLNLTIRDYKTMNWNEYRPTSNYGKPYEIKDWTDEANEDDFRDFLSLAQRKAEKLLRRKITSVAGDMKIGDQPEQYVIQQTIREIIENGDWQRYAKTNAGFENLVKPEILP